MPQNVTDVDAFTSPVTSPVGADPRNAASVLDPVQKLANRTRYLFQALFDVGAKGGSRTIYLGPRALIGNGAAIAPSTVVDYAELKTDSEVNTIDLSDRLPSGAVITSVFALIKPGAARASGGSPLHRVSWELWKNDISDFVGTGPVKTQIGSTQSDDGTTNRQIVGLSSLSETIDRDVKILTMLLKNGDTATANPDRFYAVAITFNDPGPRSW